MTAPSFPRLTFVELRKMVDTRAGFWLQLIVAVLTLVAVVLVCIFGETDDLVFREMFNVALAPASVLLPIVGILLVTSEWTQRTALITFTLVPRRMRVMSAKLAAGVVLGLIALAIALVIAAVAILIVDGEWALGGQVFGQIVLVLLTSMLIGIAFGAAFLGSAPAIVLYFALPFVFAALGAIPALNGVADWLDVTQTTTPMGEGPIDGEQWAQFWVSMAVWIGLPLVVGLIRISRGEIRAA